MAQIISEAAHQENKINPIKSLKTRHNIQFVLALMWKLYTKITFLPSVLRKTSKKKKKNPLLKAKVKLNINETSTTDNKIIGVASSYKCFKT